MFRSTRQTVDKLLQMEITYKQVRATKLCYKYNLVVINILTINYICKHEICTKQICSEIVFR